MVEDMTALTPAERSLICSIFDYQFDAGVGERILDLTTVTEVTRSRSGRLDRLYIAGGRLCTLTTSGRFTLGLAGGRVIHAVTTWPNHRVAVEAEAVPFIADGRNAFAKFVLQVDPRVRPHDEVLIVDKDDSLIGVGRSELSAPAMIAFDRGMAVSVREGIGDGSSDR